MRILCLCALLRKALPSVLIAAFLMSLCATLAQAQPVLVFGFESLDGMKVSWGADLAPTIELSQDRQYVTEGKYSAHLKGHVPAGAKGNTYIGFRLALPKPVDMRNRLIYLDAASPTPEVTQAVYFRAYDDQGRLALSFSGWGVKLADRPKTLELIPKLGGGGFAWEEGNIQAGADGSRISEIEIIIGTREKDVTFEAYVDNLRAEATPMKTWQEAQAPKKLYPDTPLVRDKKPCAVVVGPADKAWDAPLAALCDALEAATAVRFPVRRVATIPELLRAGKLPDSSRAGDEPVLDASLWGGTAPTLDGSPATAIFVGNVCDNAAMLFLHSHYFVWADHFYPGPGGFEIRTVHDPWGAGVNALVVAASDPAGVTAAIPSLKSLLARAQRTEQSFTVPRFLETHLTGEAAQRLASRLSTEPDDKYIEGQKRAAEQRLKSGAHTGLFRQIADVGESYMRSQKSGFAQLFVWLVKRAYEHYQTKPSTYGGPWGMDSDFTVYRVLPAWDVVEEDPSLTDEQRWETTRILYQWVSEVAVGKAASVVGSGVPRFNHQTFPALGLLFAGEYFRKYYGIFEAERWLKIADECFRFQATCFKSHEDCNGYQWLVWEHLCRYALARPDFAFFVPRPITEATGTEPMGVDIGGRAVKGGLWASCSNAQRVADYAILSTDSFGYSATYGDTGNFQGWWSELPVLQMINFVLRDPTYQWAIDQKMRRSGRLIQPGYYVKLEPAIPSRLAGTHVFPLDERWWAAFGGDKNAPLRRALDKAVIRGGFEEDADYAILDGLNPGGHRHFDVNALSRVCLAGRIWVADASYYNQAAKYHSTAFVLRDGLGTPHPGFAQVGHAADLPDCGATETVLKGYNGCDWHRWLVWRRGLGLLVADRFVAQQDGDYSIRIYWQLLGEPRLENGRLVLEQVGREAALAFTADASVTLADDREGGENWTGYPFIRDPVVRVLRLTYDVRLRKGEEFIAWSLLTAAEGAVGDVRLVRDGQRAVIITGTGRWSEEVGPLAAGLESPPVAGPEALRQQSGAAWLVWPGGAMLVAAGDRSAQVDFGNGKATVARPATDQPDQRATLGTEVDQKLKAEPGTIRRDLARRAAATPKTVATPAEAVPERKPAWTLWPRPDDYVLTGNRGTLAACSCLRLVTCEPQPLEQNIFGGTANSLANLFDGKVERTENCTMWAVDQPVTIRLELDAEYELTELTIQAWFATSSSKNVKFQLGEVLVEASSDGFKNDVRTAGRLVDQEQHENWGGAAHVPERYSVALNATRASAVRVHLKPRPGTAVYLAELYLRGRGGPLAAPAGLLQRALAMERFTCLAPLRVGDRTDLVAGRSDGQVWRIGADGQMVWKKEVGREVLSIGVVKFDGRIPTIVCGCRDGLVVAFAPDGSELWRTELEYYKQPPHVRVVLAADFSGQGQETAVVGADSWRYYALDAAGKVVWLYESVHVSTAAAAADIDGDGRDDVALGTNYHWWHAVRPDGKRLWQFSTKAGPECTAAAASDLDGDGRAEVAFGVADGTIQVVGPDGQLKWMVDTSDAVSFLACADINGDGRPELLAASANALAYAFDAAGRTIWHRPLPKPIKTAALAGRTLVCGCSDGSVWLVLPRDGSIVGRFETTGEPICAASLGETAVLATSLGALTAVGSAE